MAEERIQRRLAAILAADVVGFSRLMERDEAGTLAVLKARRKDVLEPLVAKYQGRVFKVNGDGVLVEFASAVNAVQCAVDLQRDMAAANGNQNDAREITLRIGVNLGDVMVEGADLYGDGVNIAARLEAIADPGGIIVSGTAFDHIKSKVKVGFDDIGPQSLKNIAELVRAYRVTDTPAVLGANTKPASDKPAIAVLPFDNKGGDEVTARLADGITEDIITDLARFRDLDVIARNSTAVYKDKAIDVRQIGRELNVGYVLEGSIQRQGTQFRVTAQLIDTATGAHVWSERWDRPDQDIFAVQTELAAEGAGTRGGMSGSSAITAEEIRKAKRRPPASLTAYDYYLLAAEGRALFTKESVIRGREAATKAITLDPNFGRAYVARAWLNYITVQYGGDF